MHKNTTGWTVKEVAEKLGVDERTIRRWCKANNTQRTIMSDGQKAQYILFKEDIEKAIAEIPKVIPEAKQELTKKYISEGIVVAKTTDSGIMRAQYELIGNLITAKEEHEKEILELKRESSAMRLELSDQKDTLQEHIENEPLKDTTMKTIRDLIHAVFEINHNSIWRELHTEFHFSALGRVSEIKGRAIIEYIKRKYFY